jgi:hypothetical protein
LSADWLISTIPLIFEFFKVDIANILDREYFVLANFTKTLLVKSIQKTMINDQGNDGINGHQLLIGIILVGIGTNRI